MATKVNHRVALGVVCLLCATLPMSCHNRPAQQPPSTHPLGVATIPFPIDVSRMTDPTYVDQTIFNGIKWFNSSTSGPSSTLRWVCLQDTSPSNSQFKDSATMWQLKKILPVLPPYATTDAFKKLSADTPINISVSTAQNCVTDSTPHIIIVKGQPQPTE
jgi:hypothetical protein